MATTCQGSSQYPPCSEPKIWVVLLQVVVRNVGPHIIQFTSMQYRNVAGSMVTLQSTADPRSPVQYRLPSVSGGSLMPHQFCNGTLLNGDQQAANMTLCVGWWGGEGLLPTGLR